MSDVTSVLKSNRRYILGTVLIGVLAYFSLMAQELNNHWDGIWHLSNFVAGDFEISLGRGLERYADRARFGVVSSPLNAVLCFLLLGASCALILHRFRLEGTFHAWLFVFLFTVNPLIGDTLSYIYLAVNYLLACFFSVLSFYVLSASKPRSPRGHLLTILAGGGALAVSLSLYQAYLNVLCALLLLYGMQQLAGTRGRRDLAHYAADAAGGILAGGAMYLLLTKALLLRAGVGMADYKGAADITPLRMLAALPASVAQCYREAYAYAFRYHFWTDREFAGILAALVAMLLLAGYAYRTARLLRRSRTRAAAFLACALLLPVAAGAVLLIAVGNVMTGLMANGLLVTILLSGHACAGPGETEGPRLWCHAQTAVLILFGWYALFTVANDQLALREGRTATVTLAGNIVSTLYKEGYPGEGQTIALIGRPGDNPAFARSAAFEQANEYAQFGLWSTDPRNNRVSWYGVLSNYLGVSLPLCDDVTFDALRAAPEIEAMPVFPAAGSIALQGDTVVVKVSDVYY